VSSSASKSRATRQDGPVIEKCKYVLTHHFCPAQIPLRPGRCNCPILSNLASPARLSTVNGSFSRVMPSSRCRCRVDVGRRLRKLQVRHFEGADTQRTCQSDTDMRLPHFAPLQIPSINISLFLRSCAYLGPEAAGAEAVSAINANYMAFCFAKRH
jgi:hypothetical protein